MDGSDYIADIKPAKKSGFIVLKTLFILYVTLGILAFTIPQNAVNWARDLKPSLAQELLLIYAERLEQISSRSGADEPYRLLRDGFLQLTGKDKDE